MNTDRETRQHYRERLGAALAGGVKSLLGEIGQRELLDIIQDADNFEALDDVFRIISDRLQRLERRWYVRLARSVGYE